MNKERMSGGGREMVSALSLNNDNDHAKNTKRQDNYNGNDHAKSAKRQKQQRKQ